MVSFLLIQVSERIWLAGILYPLLHAQKFRYCAISEFLIAKTLRHTCTK